MSLRLESIEIFLVYKAIYRKYRTKASLKHRLITHAKEVELRIIWPKTVYAILYTRWPLIQSEAIELFFFVKVQGKFFYIDSALTASQIIERPLLPQKYGFAAQMSKRLNDKNVQTSDDANIYYILAKNLLSTMLSTNTVQTHYCPMPTEFPYDDCCQQFEHRAKYKIQTTYVNLNSM